MGIPGSVLICNPVELIIPNKVRGRLKFPVSFNSIFPRNCPVSLYIEQ